MLLSGLLNFVIATLTWIVMRGMMLHDNAAPIIPTTITEQNSFSGFYFSFIFAAFATGLASFMYEIGWIRLLTLVLGAATHAFELMLSSFILGIALGGLWIKKRIDNLTHPVYFLSLTQMMKGLLALMSLFVYGQSFYLMHFFMHALARNNSGYLLFNLSSYSIAMLVMLPATFCAGITLPLITRILLAKGSGEKAVGQVYAGNTIGAIAGVFIAIHWVMPLLSLKSVIIIGAALDILIGGWLWMRAQLTE